MLARGVSFRRAVRGYVRRVRAVGVDRFGLLLFFAVSCCDVVGGEPRRALYYDRRFVSTDLLRRAVAGLTFSATILLSGAACGGGGVAAESLAVSPSSPVSAAGPSVAAGDRVGLAGSACELPVSFRLAEKWRAAGFRVEPEAADLSRKGPLTAVCEITRSRQAVPRSFGCRSVRS